MGRGRDRRRRRHPPRCGGRRSAAAGLHQGGGRRDPDPHPGSVGRMSSGVRPRPSGWARAVSPRLALLLSLALGMGGCIRELPEMEYNPLPATRPEQIDQVVYLVGDAGKAVFATSPLMARLQQDVERWSADLARQEAVSVVYLGDNVYDTGVHDVGDPLR